MLITFSTPQANITAPLNAATQIEPHTCAEMQWKSETRVRLTLRQLGNPASMASTQTHEAFIRAVFRQDPQASIRTARAVYRNQADYEKQKGT